MLDVAVPVFAGATIGYVTNWLAIKMLFWPHETHVFMGLRLPFTPGLFVRRRRDFSISLSQLVEERFCDVNDLMDMFYEAQGRGMVNQFIDEMGPLFKAGWILYARKSTPESFRADCEKIVNKMRGGHLMSSMISRKVDKMPVSEIEDMIIRVVHRELRGITWCGALLGAAIGMVQVFLR